MEKRKNKAYSSRVPYKRNGYLFLEDLRYTSLFAPVKIRNRALQIFRPFTHLFTKLSLF